MSFTISRHQIKFTHAYVELIHELLDSMSMDEDAKHFIDDDLMDRHYQTRAIFDALLEESSNKAELY